MFELDMWAPMIQGMREEMTRLGFEELKSPEEVNTTLPAAKGTSIVFVNSMCGCAGGIARPGAALALQIGAKADHLYTVFAGQDKEATAQARAHFGENPPSSPSVAVMKDGQIFGMVHRSQIEGSSPEAVAAKIKALVEAAAQ